MAIIDFATFGRGPHLNAIKHFLDYSDPARLSSTFVLRKGPFDLPTRASRYVLGEKCKLLAWPVVQNSVHEEAEVRENRWNFFLLYINLYAPKVIDISSKP